MKDQSKGALKPTNTRASLTPAILRSQARKSLIASTGDFPDRASSSNDNLLISSALGSALLLIGLSSQKNSWRKSSTLHAPIDSRLYSPGIGPEVSMSTDMKISFFLLTVSAAPQARVAAGSGLHPNVLGMHGDDLQLFRSPSSAIQRTCECQTDVHYPLSPSALSEGYVQRRSPAQGGSSLACP